MEKLSVFGFLCVFVNMTDRERERERERVESRSEEKRFLGWGFVLKQRRLGLGLDTTEERREVWSERRRERRES